MEKLTILIFFTSLGITYGQSFFIKPVSFLNQNIEIKNEVVKFSDSITSSEFIISNTSNIKLDIQMNIDCIPEGYGGASYSQSLIPYNFQIFDGDNEIDYFIQNNEKLFSKKDLLEEKTSNISSIIFTLVFNPKETKIISINFCNECHDCSYIFDTGWRKTIKYIFHSASKQKLAIYIPNDKNLSVDEGFCFLDFILKANNNYLIENNIIRSYKNNNYEWVVTIPNEVIEIICRQDFFNPLGLGDYAPYVFLYKEAFSDLEDTVLIRFRDKNLSKELLSKSDLFMLSKRQLSILRNSFYARHGYNFKNKELREYFEANCREQGVEYKVNPKFSESVFNEVERKNIELIKEMENMKEPMALSDLE